MLRNVSMTLKVTETQETFPNIQRDGKTQVTDRM